MKSFYANYRAEILGVVAAALAIAIWLVPAAKLGPVLGAIWAPGIFILYVLGSLVLVFRLSRLTTRLSRSSLIRDAKPGRRYADSLDRAESSYALLGMAAEEFQRNVVVGEYFTDRYRSGRPIRKLRFLLLHPDSLYFAERIREVNKAQDVQILIDRKRHLMHVLHEAIKSLPEGIVQDYEMRFYDEYPIWIMEFTDSKQSAETPDRVSIMTQLREAHARNSPAYTVGAVEQPLFDSFVLYFEHLWGRALTMTADGEIPTIARPPHLGVVAFDFDGTLVDTARMKHDAFRQVIRQLGPGLVEDQIEQAYETYGALNRVELFAAVIADHHLPGADLSALVSAYTTAYSSRLHEVKLVDGFADFHARFKSKYEYAIVSNAPQEEIYEVLSVLGLDGHFQKIFGHPVPKATALRRLVKDASIANDQLLYVGDRVEDMQVAASVGVRFAAVDFHGASGFGTKPALRSLDELSTAINQIEESS